ncbi:tyrosine-protein phosphatase [Streptomyces sp. SID13666]|uniref:tyrosine-protein phosphatase n=1 Tax=unclassified Streptomyces TaxID=2593676 RepID=UPI0013C2891C|nr:MULTISPECIES: tyrosine-protein phosphatase [unclassified Streptomyces]NEA56795.1 tyrosine-protein phosphatase [Streptomyces sp. SID13666]NEA72619.1 tyrosine-protein phosphatase [Streptomyces sp. SID13588]
MRTGARAATALALALVLAGPLVPAAQAAGTSPPAARKSQAPSPATAHSRVLTVPGTVNARDTGGYRTYDGATTRWNTLYRTESLAKLPPAGVTALAGLGLRAVIDLRSPSEVQADGADRLPAGPVPVALPVDDTGLYLFIAQVVGSADPAAQEAALGGDRAAQRMRTAYRGFVTSAANRAALGAAIRRIADSTGPVVVHCTAGKDRTGVLIDTVLRAVGVPQSTTTADYLLSNDLRAAADRAVRDQVKQLGLMRNPDLLIPLQEVRTEYLAAFRDQAEHDYGSFGRFLTDGLGLDPSTLVRLRLRLVA